MKSDIERGPFGAWAFHTRDQLDLSVETVAERLGYHPASLRKVESGSAQASRRMRRELPALYRQLSAEKGISVSAAPVEEATSSGERPDISALVEALDRQTAAIGELVAALGSRQLSAPAPEAAAAASAPSPWSVLIRLGRTARGMSAGGLARQAGVNTHTIELWEAGKSEPGLRQRALLLGLFASPEEEQPTARRRSA